MYVAMKVSINSFCLDHNRRSQYHILCGFARKGINLTMLAHSLLVPDNVLPNPVVDQIVITSRGHIC